MSHALNKKISGLFGALAVALMLASPAQAEDGKTKTKTAIFAGGCFWCVESDFDKLPGVLRTTSGYTGGRTDNPDYKKVTFGKTGHYEAVEIEYDPTKITYKKLLSHFWRTIDPTDPRGQFCDKGHSYKTAVFTATPEEKKLADESKAEIEKSKILKAPIVTVILPASKFYKAEEYHQDYYKKNPLRYKYYRYSCGRDQRVRALWGKEAHSGLNKK